jgi:hypothetical protein
VQVRLKSFRTASCPASAPPSERSISRTCRIQPAAEQPPQARGSRRRPHESAESLVTHRDPGRTKISSRYFSLRLPLVRSDGRVSHAFDLIAQMVKHAVGGGAFSAVKKNKSIRSRTKAFVANGQLLLIPTGRATASAAFCDSDDLSFNWFFCRREGRRVGQQACQKCCVVKW